MIFRNIPSTNEPLPAIGLGTWQTFDVANPGSTALAEVLQTFCNAGGRLIDTSPMYGRAEAAIGMLTAGQEWREKLFYATKVWTTGKEAGIRQVETSMRRMGRESVDLMQIHNLVDWETHIVTLRQWKEEGRIRYIGITHYTDVYHESLEKIIDKEPIDFVQVNFSLFDRNAERRLLPMAAEKGVATLINRPFGEGKYLARLSGKALPPWAKEAGIDSWGQFLLGYILSNPAVTCAIPATGNPAHLSENMKAGSLSLPDAQLRLKMIEFVKGI